MNRIQYTSLLLALISISFMLESCEILNDKKMNWIHPTQPAQDNTYLQLADILDNSGDLPSCATTVNQLIVRKEADNCYDDNYVKALYKAQNIYAFIDMNRAIRINRIIQTHDKNLPVIKMKNGHLIAEKFEFELDEGMQLFMKEIFFQSQICEGLDDIEFTEGKMKIKLKPCCSCCRPDS